MTELGKVPAFIAALAGLCLATMAWSNAWNRTVVAGRAIGLRK